jgi:hypothetical protein
MGPEKTGYGEKTGSVVFVLKLSGGDVYDCPDAQGEDKWCYDDSHNHNSNIPKGSVFLPHSCDEWLIGGPVQLRALIRDAKKILKQLGAANA